MKLEINYNVKFCFKVVEKNIKNKKKKIKKIL